MAKKKHYGNLLKQAMKRAGIKHYKVCDELNVSAHILNKRFEDGNFTMAQIDKVMELIQKYNNL